MIQPALEAHGLEWKGWQAYRRYLATNLKELGVEDTMTQRLYIKTAPRVAKEATRQLEEKSLVQHSYSSHRGR